MVVGEVVVVGSRREKGGWSGCCLERESVDDGDF
jgi:hypothetical protein